MTNFVIAREMWAPMSLADREKLLEGLKADPKLVHDWDAWPPAELAKHDWAALPPQIHPALIALIPVPPSAGAAAETETHTESTGRKRKGE